MARQDPSQESARELARESRPRGADVTTSIGAPGKGKRIMEAQRTRRSMGRWYILFLISLMYLITYLDRVNISTVAPVISKEFGFDKVTMGIIFSAFALVPGSRRLAERSFRPAACFGDDRGILVGDDGGDRGSDGRRFICNLSFPVRHRRGRRVPRSNPRHAALVSTPRARLLPRRYSQRQPSGSGDHASPRSLDHDYAWLAIGLLYLRCGRPCLVGVVVPRLPQLAGGARPRKQSGARTHPWHRRSGQGQCAEDRDKDKRTMGHLAAISQHVGDHVRLLYLRLLPLDLFELVALLSGGVSAFHAARGRAVGFAAALGRRRWRYGRRPGNRLALEKDWQYQNCPTGSGHHRYVGLRGVHCTGCIDRGRLHRRLLLDRCHVLSRMPPRAVLGGPHGCRRQIFRDRVWDDEHGGKHRRRALPVGLRRFRPVRLVGSAVHRGSGFACPWLRDLVILARSRRLGFRYRMGRRCQLDVKFRADEAARATP